MDANIFRQTTEKRVNECMGILVQRGANYASDKDFLENFKHSAVLLTDLGFGFHGGPITPESFAIIMCLIKLQRWSNRLRENKDPSDDWTDLINYVLLGEGCHKESASSV